MSYRLRILSVGIAAILTVGGIVMGAAASNRPAPPTKPPYRIDKLTGKLDPRSVPEQIPVVDSKGNITGYLHRDELFNENRPRVGPPAALDPLLRNVDVVSE